jgi:tRNA(Ile)-lysidine synthase
MKGHRRIKKYLIDHKVEKEQRRQLPLLLNRHHILWLVGLRRSALATVTEPRRKILAVWLENPHKAPTNCL